MPKVHLCKVRSILRWVNPRPPALCTDEWGQVPTWESLVRINRTKFSFPLPDAGRWTRTDSGLFFLTSLCTKGNPKKGADH